MLDFSKLTLKDIDLIRPYFDFATNRICDNTPATAVMWRNYFRGEYALYNSTYIYKVITQEGTTAFSVPLGRDIDGALKEIEEYCKSKAVPIIFYAVTKSDIELLSARYRLEIIPESDWGDYIYNADELSRMVGRKYAGQRNHINFFNATNPGWHFEEINASNSERVYDFYINSGLADKKTSDLFLAEREMVCEALKNFELYRMNGGFISLADGSIVAMAMGEVVGDTLFVHIEKARAEVRGAYQLIAREFPRAFCGENVKFVNREEDLGDEGLRKSKLSYHPCEIIEKFTVKVKQ